MLSQTERMIEEPLDLVRYIYFFDWSWSVSIGMRSYLDMCNNVSFSVSAHARRSQINVYYLFYNRVFGTLDKDPQPS